jgi:hypothetical protein
MALPDTIGLKAGTAKVWASTGGDYAITLTSLANDAAREGVKGDLGANWALRQNVFVETKMASAPTQGNQVEYYWCASTSATAGTDNPGNLTGADASVSNPDQVKLQLIFLGPLNLSNGIGTGAQKTRFDLFPPTRYGFPVPVNKSGVALSSTAADHKITVAPAILEVVE